MTSSTIRKRLHSYLDVANDQKLKAIYTLIEDDIKEFQPDKEDHWSDPVFVAEMDKRAAEMESGADKGRSWEEVHNNVRQKAKAK